MNILEESAFLRLSQIIGDPKANPPIPALIPIKTTAWYDGIKDGRYPKGVKIGKRAVGWRTADIRALIDRLNEQVA